MMLFKRISTTFMSRLDQVVGELENHDAVIQAALGDMRKKVAEARVRLSHVNREAERLDKDAEEHRHNAERWRRRALETADSDEHKALECLRRARQCDQQAARARNAQVQYEQSAEKLGRDIETSEQRLDAIKQKLALMRARQSAGSALSATSEIQSDAVRSLDDTLERWEIQLGELEMSLEPCQESDSLEREFISREQEADLRGELAQLRKGESER